MTLTPTAEHSQWLRYQGSLPGSPCVARLRRDAGKRPGSHFYRDEPSEPLKITAGPTSFSPAAGAEIAAKRVKYRKKVPAAHGVA